MTSELKAARLGLQGKLQLAPERTIKPSSSLDFFFFSGSLWNKNGESKTQESGR